MYTLTVLNEKNVSMSCPPHTVSGNHPMNVGENDDATASLQPISRRRQKRFEEVGPINKLTTSRPVPCVHVGVDTCRSRRASSWRTRRSRKRAQGRTVERTLSTQRRHVARAALRRPRPCSVPSASGVLYPELPRALPPPSHTSLNPPLPTPARGRKQQDEGAAARRGAALAGRPSSGPPRHGPAWRPRRHRGT